MPKYLNNTNNELSMWNFYIDKNDKIKFITKLAEKGYFRAQGAAIRTLINLCISDISILDKVISNIDNQIVYKKDGNISKN